MPYLALKLFLSLWWCSVKKNVASAEVVSLCYWCFWVQCLGGVQSLLLLRALGWGGGHFFDLCQHHHLYHMEREKRGRWIQNVEFSPLWFYQEILLMMCKDGLQAVVGWRGHLTNSQKLGTGAPNFFPSVTQPVSVGRAPAEKGSWGAHACWGGGGGQGGVGPEGNWEGHERI